MNSQVLAALGAAAGLAVGWATHWANQRLAAVEDDATEPPLPQERLWAPVLDAVLLGLLLYRFGLQLYTLVAGLSIVVLVQVLVFDTRHRLILNRVIYPAILVALLVSPVNPVIHGTQVTWQGRALAAVLGAVVAGGAFYVLSLVTAGGVGMGDAKLAAFMGALLGGLPLPIPGVARALVLGVFVGGVIAGLLLLTRLRGMRDFIPYGPFLCLGTLVQLLYPCGIGGPTVC